MTDEILQPVGFPPLPEGWTASRVMVAIQDGKTKISVRRFESRDRDHRALVIVHGLGEHSGRYLHVPHYLQHQVSQVICPDLRGHGLSSGVRGHIKRFDSLVDDVALVVLNVHRELVERFGQSEIHLLGHSLGGHLVLRTLFLYPDLPLRSAIVSAPFLGIQAKVPTAKKIGAKILRYLWPSLPLETGLKPEDISHDPAVVQAYKNDPLNHGKMTPGLYGELQDAFKDTLARTSGIVPPVLFLVPLADRLVDFQATLGFYDRLQHPQKQLKKYEGLFHEPLNETSKQETFRDLETWLEQNH